MKSISASERKFISEGVAQDIRTDGRGRMDHRYFDLKTEVILNANGSARLKLDHTDIIVAVKVSIEEPATESPDIGRVECSVECAPSASLQFQGRGADTVNLQLTSMLNKIVSSAVDKKQLCIISRHQCWVVYVDAIVLDSSGNLSDALSMGTYAALCTTRIPAIKVVEAEETNESIVEVSDDPYETTKLALYHPPVTVSLTKIGGQFVVDASAEEEACMSAQVTFGVTKDGQICSTSKTGIGGISVKVLTTMMKVASSKGKGLIEKIDKMIKDGIAKDEDIEMKEY
mmetsp:Transcript_17972/g.26935  ORF Transcript_17972/g.26935 Transcript_17972/m.26935 type:complete len:287 (+) Transcript_17972:1-861(+)